MSTHPRALLPILFGLALAACGGGHGGSRPPPPPPADPPLAPGFVHASGRDLVVGDSTTPMHLRGVCFSDFFGGGAPPPAHHDERDLARVRGMGMNAVRLYLAAAWLEDPSHPGAYRQDGWQWLDQTVAWARRQAVYLILDMQVPFGGYQSDGRGAAAWTAANRARLVSLWRAIAARYRDENAIAAYDLLNEPAPAAPAEWQSLAQELVDAIRGVDPNHLLVVERINVLQGGQGVWVDPAQAQVVVSDPRGDVMYDFHFYEPYDYTHQSSWLGFGEGGAYPDAARPELSPMKILGAGPTSGPLPPASSSWQLLSAAPAAIPDAAHTLAVPAFAAQAMGGGEASFDDLTVGEYGPDGGLVREVAAVDPEVAGPAGWSYFPRDATGRLAASTATPHAGAASLSIAGTVGLGVAYDPGAAFQPTDGAGYAISGWARGSDLPASALGAFTLLRFANPDGGPIPVRDRAFLEREVHAAIAFRDAHEVPMNVGEFGLNRPCFDGGRGGLAWAEDVLDLLIEHDLSFTHHAYHESAFGLFRNDEGLPDPARANQPLIDLFTRKLSARP